MNRTKVRGKILVCRHSEDSYESRVSKSMTVKKAGAAGMILIDEMGDHVANHFVLPGTAIGKEMGDKILSYMNSTRLSAHTSIKWTFFLASQSFSKINFYRCASAMILPAKTILGFRAAPHVAAFSSRGPNSLTPEILKVSRNKLGKNTTMGDN